MRCFFLALVCSLALVIATVIAGGIRWNLSGSAAPGLYRAVERPPQRGDLVAVCLPQEVARWALGRGYLSAGRCQGGVKPVGKRIAGCGGDLVTISPGEIAINGRRLASSRRIGVDSKERPMPLFPEGDLVLASDELWLHSSRHERSLDSRVYGPVAVGDVVEVLEPLWILEDAAGLYPGSQ